MPIQPIVLGKEGDISAIFLQPPSIPLTTRTGLVCLIAMPTQHCSCGSVNFSISWYVLVYHQQGIRHHSCQVSSRSFLQHAPVSPQLSALLLYCDFLFTQHMLPNSFKRQLSFTKVFLGVLFGFFLINLTLDKCLTISHYKPISLCKASVSPKGPPSLIFPISIQSNNQFPLEISYPKSPTFEQLQSSFYTYLSRELPFCLFRSYFLLTHQLYESVLLDLCIILYKRHNLHVLLLVFIIYLQQIHLLYF